MAEEMLTPESVTLAQLQAVFDAALFQVSADADAQTLRITGDHVLWVILSESKRLVRFVGMFQLPAQSSLDARLALANRINVRLLSIRAAIGGEQQDRLCLDHYLSLRAGVTGKCVALAFKQFQALVAGALQEAESLARDTVKLQVKSSFPESRTTSDRAMLASPPTPRFWR